MFTHEFSEPFGIYDIPKSLLLFPEWQRTTLQTTITFSCFCLVLSFIVYSLIPDLRTVPGKCLMGLIFSQFTTNICILFAFQLPSRTTRCFLNGVCLHYFALSGMYWTNIIGYDLMWKLLNPVAKRGRSHFKRYFVIVYTIPAVYVAIALSYEFQIFDKKESIFKPEYGKVHCGVSSWTAKIIYISIPVTVSVIFNLVIFLYAIFRMRRFAVELRHLEILVPPLIKRLGYFGKLSLLLGFSGMFGHLGFQAGENVNVRFVIFLYVTLQGLYIFMAFTCKRSIFNKLLKRAKSWKCSASSAIAGSTRTLPNHQGPISVIIISQPRAQSCKF